MIIKVEGGCKSISSFESDELEDFAVVTGKNGSCRTQLVDLIKSSVDHNLKQQEASSLLFELID